VPSVFRHRTAIFYFEPDGRALRVLKKSERCPGAETLFRLPLRVRNAARRSKHFKPYSIGIFMGCLLNVSRKARRSQRNAPRRILSRMHFTVIREFFQNARSLARRESLRLRDINDEIVCAVHLSSAVNSFFGMFSELSHPNSPYRNGSGSSMDRDEIIGETR
jgi:hypothetical protein